MLFYWLTEFPDFDRTKHSYISDKKIYRVNSTTIDDFESVSRSSKGQRIDRCDIVEVVIFVLMEPNLKSTVMCWICFEQATRESQVDWGSRVRARWPNLLRCDAAGFYIKVQSRFTWNSRFQFIGRHANLELICKCKVYSRHFYLTNKKNDS